MSALQTYNLIKRLTLPEKLDLVELIFKDIRKETASKKEEEANRRKAAELLLEDYRTDKDLTAFTALDQEDFYETK